MQHVGWVLFVVLRTFAVLLLGVGVGAGILAAVDGGYKAVQLVGQDAPSTSPSGRAVLYMDSTANTVQFSENGGSYFNVTSNHSAYKAADENINSDAVLSNDSVLSVSVDAGKKYLITARLFMNETAGGVQVALGGTATATSLKANIAIWDTVNRTNTIVTALGSAASHGGAGGGAHYIPIDGTIEVNAAGTLTIQWAQNTTNVATLTMQRNSYLLVQPQP